MSTSEVFDRRVRRSRSALRAAIVELVSVMDYDQITVADILLRADVARGTFYAHYADRDALFGDAVDHLLDELVEDVLRVAALGTTRLTGQGIRVMFDHAGRHRDLYLAMLTGAAAGRPLAGYVARVTATYGGFVQQTAASAGVTPRMPVEAIARCWAGETLSLILWWLRDGTDVDVDDVTRMRMLMMTGGATWAIGLEPGQLTFDDQLAQR